MTSSAADLLWRAAERFGQRPAIVERGTSVAYGELRDRAAARAARSQALRAVEPL